MHVHLRLMDVTCSLPDGSEEPLGDELYILSGMFETGTDVKAGATTPVGINGRETKAFRPVDGNGRPESTILDTEVPYDSTIRGALIAYDEAFPKDWRRRPELLEALSKEFGVKLIAAGSAADPVGLLTATAATAVDLIAPTLPIADHDEQLGSLELAFPAAGPPVELRTWTFRGGGWDWSSWTYTVRFEIVRNGPQLQMRVDPPEVRAHEPVTLSVRAVDVSSGEPVSGDLWIGDVKAGATNAPFTFTFATPATATVRARGYLDAACQIKVQPRRLLVRVDPNLVPVGEPVRLRVVVEDADTHMPVTGEVFINGRRVAATGELFTYTFRCRPVRERPDGELRCPVGAVTAPGYVRARIDFGFHAQAAMPHRTVVHADHRGRAS